MKKFENIRIGYAVTGSFCTFEKAFEQAKILREMGAEIVPIMSENAFGKSTRFGESGENVRKFEEICGREIISDIESAEPIGPKNLTDIMVISPCTSNTLSKLACSITDTSVTMAVKSHLRSGKPVLLAIASNDSLSGSAKNIGELLNRRNYYFVPMRQDDIEKKPTSLVADFTLIPKCVELAMKGLQLRPIIT